MAEVTAAGAGAGRATASADSAGAGPASRKTRRRDDVLLAAIREAVRAETEENGYAGVSFEGVARRAKTSKPVLYRRFPSRAHMVADAFISHITGSLRAPSTGTLRGDLEAILRVGLRQVRALGPGTFRALVGEADEGLLGQIVDPYIVTILREVEAAARDRGKSARGRCPSWRFSRVPPSCESRSSRPQSHWGMTSSTRSSTR